MVAAPAAFGTQKRTSLSQDVRFKRREFVANVGHAAVSSDGKRLFRPIRSDNGLLTSLAELGGNVGLTTSFPWLSQVAKFFDKFCFHTLNFDYTPSSSSATAGTVALCPTYKSDEESLNPTKGELLDRAGSSRSSPWMNQRCSIDPKKANSTTRNHFVRTGNTTDKKLTDPYRLDVMVETPVGENSETPLGELWVDYDVSLTNPKGNSSSSMNAFNYRSTVSEGVITSETKIGNVDFVESEPVVEYYETEGQPQPMGTHVKFVWSRPGYFVVDVQVLSNGLSAIDYAARGGSYATGAGYFSQTTYHYRGFSYWHVEDSVFTKKNPFATSYMGWLVNLNVTATISFSFREISKEEFDLWDPRDRGKVPEALDAPVQSPQVSVVRPVIGPSNNRRGSL